VFIGDRHGGGGGNRSGWQALSGSTFYLGEIGYLLLPTWRRTPAPARERAGWNRCWVGKELNRSGNSLVRGGDPPARASCTPLRFLTTRYAGDVLAQSILARRRGCSLRRFMTFTCAELPAVRPWRGKLVRTPRSGTRRRALSDGWGNAAFNAARHQQPWSRRAAFWRSPAGVGDGRLRFDHDEFMIGQRLQLEMGPAGFDAGIEGVVVRGHQRRNSGSNALGSRIFELNGPIGINSSRGARQVAALVRFIRDIINRFVFCW